MHADVPDQLQELFAAVDGTKFRRLFGGIGIYRDGIMFALVADDAVYLKADETSQAGFKAEGCGPFVYEAKGKPVVMSYWRLPERLYDELDEFREWALAAFAAAQRAHLKTTRKGRKRGAGG